MAGRADWTTRLAHYVLSLPERALRSATGLAAGILREVGDVTIPGALRRTRLYQTLVESTLRFLIEQVARVEGAYPEAGKLAEDFALRRAAGNGIELVGILTFRASPVWVLAALADASGAGRHLISEIAVALKKDGLLDKEADFETVDQLLDGLERSAGRLAETINTPPLDVAGLRAEWAAFKRELPSIPARRRPSAESLEGLWSRIAAEAKEQNRSVFEITSLMALSTARAFPGSLLRFSRAATLATRRTGELVGDALLSHYSNALREIRETGFLAYWTREYSPYLRAAAQQFHPGRQSSTERWLSRRRF